MLEAGEGARGDRCREAGEGQEGRRDAARDQGSLRRTDEPVDVFHETLGDERRRGAAYGRGVHSRQAAPSEGGIPSEKAERRCKNEYRQNRHWKAPDPRIGRKRIAPASLIFDAL